MSGSSFFAFNGIEYGVRQEMERGKRMQQFIRYLYEYEEGKRVRNIGFVKVEIQDEKCAIHIHGKGVDSGDVQVFVIVSLEGENLLAEQGNIRNENALIHFVLRFEAEDVGGEEGFEKILGVVLQHERKKTYMALWEEGEMDIDNMMTLKKWEEQMREIPCEKESKICAEEVESIEQEEYIPQSPKRMYEKISRKDISRLPRKEWRLANNSFLLHGFYNYHHLLYIKEDENCWLGVPGIYHEKEAAAAKAFGFPQFHRLEDETIELTKEETNSYEDFGYWCRLV